MTKKATKTKAVGTTKAPKAPTVAHGATGKAPAAKDAKKAEAAKGAKPATALAEDKLSPGAKADLAKVREATGKPDPALDQALANAGKAKAAKKAKAGKPKGERKGGVLEAAVKVLQAAGKPMNCQDIVKEALAKGLWKTEGKTPHGTLHAAIGREIANPARGSRFKKVDRGLFTLAAAKEA